MPPFTAEVAVARSAQSVWTSLPIAERVRPLRRFRELLAARADEFGDAAKEVGRDADDLVATDLLPTAAAAKYLAQHAARILKPRRVARAPLWLLGCRDVVYRRPHGVVAVVGTWNYPVFLNAVPILHAVVAGNAILWKPSERTPRSAELLHRTLLDAGFPAGLIQRLPEDRENGPRLAEAEIDFLHFTGSDAVGSKLAARLGERLIPSALELSGCDAAFVFPDADTALSARAIWYAATLNAGRTCMATRRAFVHRDVFDRVAAELKALAAAGPAGAKLLYDIGPESEFCTTASFAPAVAVLRFDDADDAVRQHSLCPLKLTASVFTKDAAFAAAFATRLPVGNVTVNDAIAPTAHPGTPFGGRGRSGWGVTQGDEGLLQMTVPQAVSVRRGSFRPHVDALLKPHPANGAVTRGLLRLTHGRGVRERFAGLRQMLGGVRQLG